MNAVANLVSPMLIGALFGAGSVIYFVSRFDRQQQNGCFYIVLLSLITMVIGVIVLVSING